MKNWFALLARSGTPKEIVDKLSSDIARALSRPDIKERLDSLGLDPYIGSPDQLAALMKVDMAKYAKIIKAANIKMENWFSRSSGGSAPMLFIE